MRFCLPESGVADSRRTAAGPPAPVDDSNGGPFGLDADDALRAVSGTPSGGGLRRRGVGYVVEVTDDSSGDG